MKYSNSFGKNSAKVLLGTAYFGDTISKEDAFSIMDTYVELGGTHIDTARLYADGEAETVIGAWIKSRKPQNLFLSTKGAFPRKETPDVSRLSETEIRSDVEESLRALKVEAPDFYWLHRDDEAIPVGQIIETMNKLQQEGKIQKFGASNWRYYRIREANEYAKEHGVSGFSASQVRFSPAVIAPNGTADRTLVDIDKPSYQFYREQNMPVAAYASQAKGLFSKLDALGVEGLNQKSKERYLCEENLEKLEIIRTLSEKYNCSIAAVVIGALCSLKQPDVFPIIGGSRVEQIVDSMQGADVTLTEQELDRLFLYRV